MMELTEEIMYKAIVEKDTSFEGVFFTAVKTTGIFCRPSCTARKSKLENVEFFKTSNRDNIFYLFSLPTKLHGIGRANKATYFRILKKLATTSYKFYWGGMADFKGLASNLALNVSTRKHSEIPNKTYMYRWH